jgi:SAM-dependent methyltransferase
MLHHSLKCVGDNGNNVGLVQAIGEELPFQNSSFDWVVCKGALDHFPDPYRTIEEISRVLRSDGKTIISIANFESLGHKLGKNTHKLTKFLPWRDRTKRQAWETPPDHTYRFDYALVRNVISSHLYIEESVGISFLWGAPLWDKMLALLSRKLSFALMAFLDRIARRCPHLSDVILVRCRRKSA